MATKKKLLQAAAGAAGGEALNVEDVFSTYLYSGDATTRDIVNNIDLAGEGGLVWIKTRNAANGHFLFDTERGVQKYLQSNTTGAEGTLTNALSAFNSDGFEVKIGLNNTGDDQASWTFRKAPKFFDVVTYTGDGVSGRTISHNLGCEVGCIITKRLDSSVNDWSVYHRKANPTAPQNVYLELNTTNGAAGDTAYWNDTAPTDTVFTVGNGNTNFSGEPYVAYLFAHNDGDGEFGPNGDADIIKCGSYTGNGSSTGPVIDLGFEPQWLMIKNTSSSSGDWNIFDTMRGIPTGGNDSYLAGNTSAAEGALYNSLDLTSTGFQPKVDFTYINGNGNNYIYIAIRRGPMAVPTDATDVFSPNAYTATGAAGNRQATGFPVDLSIIGSRNSPSSWQSAANPRITGGNKYNITSSTASEATTSTDGLQFDDNTGFSFGGASLNNNSSMISWNFRRAPSFFDVVAYTGNGTAGHTVSHNLGVAPEMMWVKNRNDSSNWSVNGSVGGLVYGTNKLVLQTTGGILTDTNEVTAASATNFTLGDSVATNGTGDGHVAYLFASLDGVSKVGSYTGTGSSQTIDCGFSSGARFVMIKKTNGNAGWFVFDSERGIVSGDDPYLFLNDNLEELTSVGDAIDPNAAGFNVVTSNSDLNGNGDTYIFYAIA